MIYVEIRAPLRLLGPTSSRQAKFLESDRLFFLFPTHHCFTPLLLPPRLHFSASFQCRSHCTADVRRESVCAATCHFIQASRGAIALGATAALQETSCHLKPWV